MDYLREKFEYNNILQFSYFLLFLVSSITIKNSLNSIVEILIIINFKVLCKNKVKISIQTGNKRIKNTNYFMIFIQF